MAASWKLTLGLLLVLIGYLLFGGWLFRYLEKDEEAKTRKKLKSLYAELTSAVHIGCANPTRILRLIGQLSGVNETDDLGNSTEVKWDYDGAVFFSFTVVSTIGYGTLAPATRYGRIAFIFFGLAGIPLFLILLNFIAELAKEWHAKLRERHKRCHNLFSFVLYGWIAAAIFFIPSYVVAWVEGWTYVDSMYFAFQTLTTVGFGDLVPGVTKNTFPKAYRLFIILWVVIGLAYTSALISFLFSLDMRFLQALLKLKSGKDEKTKTQLVQTTPVETWQDHDIENMKGTNQ